MFKIQNLKHIEKVVLNFPPKADQPLAENILIYKLFWILCLEF